MEPVDTLVTARWVVPVEPEERVLDDHSVAIRGGRIVAVLPAAEARRRYAAAEVVDRPWHVLLPGLVNAHTHASMVLLRGQAEGLALGEWQHAVVGPLERRWVDPEYVRDGTELAVAEMLRGGVTCFADTQLWPEVVAQAAAALHMRASVGLVVTESPNGWATSANDCIDRGMHLRDLYRGDPLIATHFAPHRPGLVTDGTLVRVRRLADELEMPVVMQLHETPGEVTRGLEQHGRRPLARLASLGLASPLLVAVHMTHVDDADVDALAASGASIVHCPESSLRLGSGVCPVTRLRSRGVRVALGTDAAAANNDLDVLGEARTAGLLASGVAASPGELSASNLLRMATLDGARTLGLADVTGSLLPGKWADLCCLNLREPRTWPVADVPAAVVYAASSRQVTDTWVAGRRLLADQSLLYMDETAVLDRAEAWRGRIAATFAEGQHRA